MSNVGPLRLSWILLLVGCVDTYVAGRPVYAEARDEARTLYRDLGIRRCEIVGHNRGRCLDREGRWHDVTASDDALWVLQEEPRLANGS